MHGENNGGILAALTLVHCDRIGEVQGVQVVSTPLHETPVEVDVELAARGAQEAAARSAYLPQVFLAGGVRFASAPGRTDQHSPFVKDDYNLFNGAVVLGLRQSFEWGMLDAEVDRARARRRQLEAQQHSGQQGIRLEIESAHGAYRRAEAELTGALEGRNLVREWVQLAQDEFELDPSQVKELISAFEALAGSEEAYYRAIYRHNVALAELERVIGAPLRTDETP